MTDESAPLTLAARLALEALRDACQARRLRGEQSCNVFARDIDAAIAALSAPRPPAAEAVPQDDDRERPESWLPSYPPAAPAPAASAEWCQRFRAKPGEPWNSTLAHCECGQRWCDHLPSVREAASAGCAGFVCRGSQWNANPHSRVVCEGYDHECFCGRPFSAHSAASATQAATREDAECWEHGNFNCKKCPPPDEQRGIYGKYRVERISDPSGKHSDCWYFVLDLHHDEFTVPALLAYANACESRFPKLAAELREKIGHTVPEATHPAGSPCPRFRCNDPDGNGQHGPEYTLGAAVCAARDHRCECGRRFSEHGQAAAGGEAVKPIRWMVQDTPEFALSLRGSTDDLDEHYYKAEPSALASYRVARPLYAAPPDADARVRELEARVERLMRGNEELTRYARGVETEREAARKEADALRARLATLTEAAADVEEKSAMECEHRISLSKNCVLCNRWAVKAGTQTPAEGNQPEEALKPCPFCGGQADFRDSEDDENAVLVGCGTCGASSAWGYSIKEDCRDHLTLLWNRRTGDGVTVEQLADAHNEADYLRIRAESLADEVRRLERARNEWRREATKVKAPELAALRDGAARGEAREQREADVAWLRSKAAVKATDTAEAFVDEALELVADALAARPLVDGAAGQRWTLERRNEGATIKLNFHPDPKSDEGFWAGVNSKNGQAFAALLGDDNACTLSVRRVEEGK